MSYMMYKAAARISFTFGEKQELSSCVCFKNTFINAVFDNINQAKAPMEQRVEERTKATVSCSESCSSVATKIYNK